MGTSQNVKPDSRSHQSTPEASRQRSNLKQSIFKHLFGIRAGNRTRTIKQRPAAAAAEAQNGEMFFKNCNLDRDFDVGPVIGTGSYGRVFIARHCRSGRVCAIKTMSKAGIIKTNQTHHVKCEMQVMKKFSHHPNIARLLGICQDDSSLSFIMEYVPGGEIFTHLRTCGKFAEGTCKFYVAELTLVFEYLHARGVVYRDLKPENLLLDGCGHIKLTDFGFAKELNGRSASTLCGTPEYLAPEIILQAGHGTEVDWWALGVLCFEMLAGYSPFYDKDIVGLYQKIVSSSFRFPSEFSPVSKDFIRALLEPDRRKRLGCGIHGIRNLKRHPWFSDLDWRAVERREVLCPIRPELQGHDDTSNFDDYSHLGPLNHPFPLTIRDQTAFQNF